MIYQVYPGPTFERDLKLILKKYPKFIEQLNEYLEDIEKTGPKGPKMTGFNILCKDRLPITAYNIGERGGIRFITYYDEEKSLTVIVPFMIYLKSVMENPTKKMIKKALKELKEFLADIPVTTPPASSP